MPSSRTPPWPLLQKPGKQGTGSSPDGNYYMFPMVLDIVVEAWIEDTSSWPTGSSSCLPLRQGFLLPRSLLLVTPSLSKQKESLAEPPSRTSPHCPPHLLLAPPPPGCCCWRSCGSLVTTILSMAGCIHSALELRTMVALLPWILTASHICLIKELLNVLATLNLKKLAIVGLKDSTHAFGSVHTFLQLRPVVLLLSYQLIKSGPGRCQRN